VHKVALYFSSPAVKRRLVVGWGGGERKKEKRKKERKGEKKKMKERKTFGLSNSTIQTICKNRTKIISALE